MCIRDRVTTGQVAATGVIMLAAMPVLIGLQLLLAFLSYDIASVPKHALSARLQVCLQEPPQ